MIPENVALNFFGEKSNSKFLQIMRVHVVILQAIRFERDMKLQKLITFQNVLSEGAGGAHKCWNIN